MNVIRAMNQDYRRHVKITILQRAGGTWDQSEIDKLVNSLRTDLSCHPKHPEFLVIFGHHSIETMIQLLDGGSPFTITQITGIYNKELPFVPSFA